jgi:hypothetical protein
MSEKLPKDHKGYGSAADLHYDWMSRMVLDVGVSSNKIQQTFNWLSLLDNFYTKFYKWYDFLKQGLFFHLISKIVHLNLNFHMTKMFTM